MRIKINKENQKLYNRKYQLLLYYSAKQNKTENDLNKIKNLKEELNMIKQQNKIEGKRNSLQIELNRLKNELESGIITRFDVEDVLFCMEMQRKAEIMKQCINMFLISDN